MKLLIQLLLMSYCALILSCQLDATHQYNLTQDHNDQIVTQQEVTYDISNKYKCSLDSFQLLSIDYLSVLEALELCQKNADTPVNTYCYCDTTCFNVYNLGQDVIIIEMLEGIGRDGYDYYFVKENKGQYNLIKFFTGYMLCIQPNENQIAEIIVQFNRDSNGQVISIISFRENDFQEKIIDISGPDISNENRAQKINKLTSQQVLFDI